MTAESGRAEAVVRGFVEAYLSLRNEVLAWCTHQVAPAETLADFLRLVWSGTAPRSAISENVGYSVHGRIGCQLRSPDGTEVDIDLRDDLETFDLWRLHRYERSLGVTSELTDEALRSACQAFVDRGELEVARPGWYALPGGKLRNPADA
jgi:hypothetical protein